MLGESKRFRLVGTEEGSIRSKSVRVTVGRSEDPTGSSSLGYAAWYAVAFVTVWPVVVAHAAAIRTISTSASRCRIRTPNRYRWEPHAVAHGEPYLAVAVLPWFLPLLECNHTSAFLCQRRAKGGAGAELLPSPPPIPQHPPYRPACPLRPPPNPARRRHPQRPFPTLALNSHGSSPSALPANDNKSKDPCHDDEGRHRGEAGGGVACRRRQGRSGSLWARQEFRMRMRNQPDPFREAGG